MEKKKRMAVVTTDSTRRGVFFGEVVKHDIANGVCTLNDAQMCVYWSRETRGVVGLASIGPQAGSRVTPIIPFIELNGVTAIIDATGGAASAWREMPWN